MRGKVQAVVMVLLLGISMVPMCQVFAGEFQGYDTWLVIEFRPMPVRLVHVRFYEELVDDRIVYVEHEELIEKARLLDGGIIDKRYIMESRFDEDWELISFYERKLDGDRERSVVCGESQDGKLYVKVIEDGNVSQHVIELPDDYYDLSSDAALINRLGNEIVVGDTYHGYGFDRDVLEFSPVSVTIEERTTYEDNNGTLTEVYVIDCRTDEVSYKLYAGLNGEPLHIQYYSGSGAIVSRVEADSLPDIVPYDVRTRWLETNKNIPRYSRVDSFTVKLYFDHDMPTGLNLLDNRTKIVGEELLDSRYVLTLEISQENRDFTDMFEFPVEDPSLSRYLLPDPGFTEVENELIKTRVREIVGDETDVWRASVMLAHWIKENPDAFKSDVEWDLSVDQRKRTENYERVRWFTALARSLQIPTKVIAGYHYAGDVFGMYFWNEIWLGEWITFDISKAEAHTSPLLLKICELDGRSPIDNWRLFDDLVERIYVEVSDYSMRPDPNMDGLVTGVENGVYTNAEYGFRIKAPGDEWEICVSEEDGSLVFVLDTDFVLDGVLSGYVSQLPTVNMTVRELSEILAPKNEEYIEEMIPGCEILSTEELRINGFDAYKRVFSGKAQGLTVYIVEMTALADTTTFYIIGVYPLILDEAGFMAFVEDIEVF